MLSTIFEILCKCGVSDLVKNWELKIENWEFTVDIWTKLLSLTKLEIPEFFATNCESFDKNETGEPLTINNESFWNADKKIGLLFTLFHSAVSVFIEDIKVKTSVFDIVSPMTFEYKIFLAVSAVVELNA